jgi:hypothetical protein
MGQYGSQLPLLVVGAAELGDFTAVMGEALRVRVLHTHTHTHTQETHTLTLCWWLGRLLRRERKRRE